MKSDGIKRSLVKTISWRIIGTLDTIVIAERYLVGVGLERRGCAKVWD